MSEENVATLRSIYGEWEQGNLRAGRNEFDPEVTVKTFMPDANEPVILEGLDQFERFVRDWLTQWQNYRVTGEDFREVEADKILVSGRQIATGHRSGIAVESPAFAVWTFRESKVVKLSLHYDRDDALKAAGLSE
jgi:ketosteroid isomerase-like protein